MPHAGERVPPEVSWLQGLGEPHLMRDVDRYVDELYDPVIKLLQIPAVIADTHRYVVDLNRFEHEFDAQAVAGAPLPAGQHPKGLHWSITTEKEPLITQPMPMALHEELLAKYYRPFHDQVKSLRQSVKKQGRVYHLDAHSMPSVGTSLHPDPGERRADVVISDFYGKSCESAFRDLVLRAYQDAGFQVAYNYPYIGGGITQMYGQPDQGCHTLQVELNRDLYMNETSKDRLATQFIQVQKQISAAIKVIYNQIKEWA